jgi:hypothetical protein
MMETAEKHAYILKLRSMTPSQVFAEWSARYDARDNEYADIAATEVGKRPTEEATTETIQL